MPWILTTAPLGCRVISCPESDRLDHLGQLHFDFRSECSKAGVRSVASPRAKLLLLRSNFSPRDELRCQTCYLKLSRVPITGPLLFSVGYVRQGSELQAIL